MYLCASSCDLLATATSFLLCVSPALTSLLMQHRMCFTRLIRRARATLSFPGRLFLVYFLLDTVYLACFHEAALLPVVWRNDSGDHLADRVSLSESSSSDSLSPVSSPSPSSSSPVAVPPPAALLSPSSLSSSSSLLSSSSLSALSLSARDTQTNSSRSVRGNATISARSLSQLGDNSSRENTANDVHNSSSVTLNTTVYSSNHPNKSKNRTDVANSADNDNNSSRSSSSNNKNNNKNKNQLSVSSYQAGPPAKAFPFALVVASSTAAVSILLFFCLSYIWHTRQLDRRAQKLAIRLAAESEVEVNCSQCRTPTTYVAGSSQDSGTDSCGEEVEVLQSPASPVTESPSPLPQPPTVMDELNCLNEEDELEAEGEDGSRRKAGGVGRTLGGRRGSRGRGRRRSGSRSSRKWSGHSGGLNRSSLVTDQEILNHFASRRHSTFFI